MPRWQRNARFVLAAIFLGVVVSVAVLMRPRDSQVQPARPERLDPKAVLETRGGDVVQLTGERRDVRIEFASQVLYDDGRTKLTDFKASVDNRGGRSYVVSGKEAFVGAERSSYDVRGSVSLATSDGLAVTTEQATFTEAEGLLRGPGRVQFTRENMSGSGVGFTYDRQQDSVWLHDQAVVRFAASSSEPGLEVTAATGGYSRLQRYARFERGVRMTRGGQVIEADHATMFLQAQIDEPDRIELRGSARITGGGSMGTLQTMAARDINLDYAADGRTLEQALLAGGSSIQLAQPGGAPGQQLSGEYIDVVLSPDGAVTRLASREAVRMTLPAIGDTPARVITSHSLEGAGEPQKGLTAATFEGAPWTEFQEASGGGSRVARGRTLKALLAPSGTVDSAVFSSGFRFADGELRAASVDAHYDVTRGTLSLASAKGVDQPRVDTNAISIVAPQLTVTLSPRTIRASGGVNTTLAAQRRQSGEQGMTLLNDSQPVTIAAETLVFDEGSSRSEYTGKAWLTQGSTSIRADSLALDDRRGELTAAGSVVAVLPIAGKSADGTTTATSTARAGEFRFLDAKRQAIFSSQAQLDGAQGNVRAERIELLLAPKDNTLDRLDAQGPAVAVLVESRRASGTRLTYLPTTEEYQLAGSPVRLVEGCRETIGRTLTFFRSSERMLVDGNEEQRTQTRGNTKCPESPR